MVADVCICPASLHPFGSLLHHFPAFCCLHFRVAIQQLVSPQHSGDQRGRNRRVRSGTISRIAPESSNAEKLHFQIAFAYHQMSKSIVKSLTDIIW